MPTYRLRIARGGAEFEAEGDKAFVLEMLKKFETQTSRPALTPSDQPPSSGVGIPSITTEPPTKGVSIREFVRQLGIKRHTDITLAFGYYLEKYSGVAEFTPADVNNCYYEAKMETSNTSQMLIQNIKRGFMMEARGGEKNRKRYTLTSSGERYVESKLASARSE